MPLNSDDVRKIAYLARIKIDETELNPLAGELNDIIGWVEQLNEVDTMGVKPMTSVAEMLLPQRKDEVNAGDVAEEVLVNASNRFENFYTVPKVVD